MRTLGLLALALFAARCSTDSALALTPADAAASGAETDFGFLAPPPGAQPCGVALPPPRQVGSETFDYVSCYKPSARTEVWTITQPDPTAAEVPYAALHFAKGDLVSVTAGGCVQTGGHGSTTFRYVAPQDRGGDPRGFYYGSLRIPGVIDATRLSDLIPAGPLHVGSDPGTEGYLRLQYQDDGYGDNGYYSRDGGLSSQCNEMEPAWVAIAIQRGCDGDDAACITGAPLDLLTDARDDNTLPLNPMWSWFALTGTDPAPVQLCNFSAKLGTSPKDTPALCTRQPTDADHAALCGFVHSPGALMGHLNWTTATYTGTLSWGSHSKPIEDDDYTIHFASDARRGEIYASDAIDIEFDSSEVIDNMQSGWWTALHAAVDREDQGDKSGPTPHQLLDGKRAIVTGLLGLDCAHECGTELHPGYGMAIHVSESADDDVWAIFARNWGDEGFCGANDHPVQLPGNVLRLRLPAPALAPGAQAKLLSSSDIHTSDPSVTVALSSDDGGALVTVQLQAPEQRPLADAELHLSWRLPNRSPP